MSEAIQAQIAALQLSPLPRLREEVQVLERQAQAESSRRRYRAQLDEVQNHLTSIEDRVRRAPPAEVVSGATDRVNAARAALTAATLDVEHASWPARGTAR
jgi:hypothetical protein